jgi:hypothetical protein
MKHIMFLKKIKKQKTKQEKTKKSAPIGFANIKNLQHKTSFLTCIYIFPLVTYKDFPFYGKYA